ncbi:MAG: CaiB/BaiF CoA transferase family protein [Candidatus Limnocylindrales bacterium]
MRLTALQGIRVLELGRMVPAAFCAQMLADSGAAVVKVEPPGGDPARRFGPFVGDQGPETSALFLALNRNKRSVTLDHTSTAGREALERLLGWADVLVTNLSPRELDAAGLDPMALSERHRRLVVVAVTPYGLTGPYRDRPATDLTISAAGGLSVGIGDPDREPLALPELQAGHQSGLAAAIGAMAALFARRRTGRGQVVDVSETDVLATVHTGYHLPNFLYRGIGGIRAGHRMGLGLYPMTVLPCADGYVYLSCPQMEQWQRFLHLMGDPAWTEEPRYRNRRAMTEEYPDEVDALLIPWLMQHTRAELFTMCREAHIPCAPLNTIADVVADDHLRERGFFERIDHPVAGTATYPGVPFRISGDAGTPHRPAPLLGEHTAEVAAEVGIDTEVASAGQTVNAPQTRALSGIRILDFGTAWAGPMAGQILADLGAEVIKIESHTRMDGLRLGRPIIGEDAAGGDRGEWPELQPIFHALNRNKLGVTINMKTPEGVELIRQLATHSDATLSNYSPHVLDRLGLGFDSLRAVRPDIVMVEMTAAGDSGPLRDIVSYNSIILGLSGFGSLLGYEDEFIGMTQTGFADAVASLTAAYALLVGLWERDTTSEGRHVELSEWEATTALLGMQIVDYSVTGREARAAGNASRTMAPHGNYPTADGWIGIAVRDDAEWERLADLAGHRDWLSPGFATAPLRLERRGELDALVAAWSRTQSGEDLAERLTSKDVPAAQVMTIADQFADPHFGERGIHLELEHPRVGAEYVHGFPFHLSATPASLERPAPLLGQHNADVLGALLKLPETEMTRLAEAGVIN